MREPYWILIPDVPDKTEDDADREAQLLEMRLTLTEERNAVMVPSAGSGIPGAPAEWYHCRRVSPKVLNKPAAFRVIFACTLINGRLIIAYGKKVV